MNITKILLTADHLRTRLRTLIQTMFLCSLTVPGGKVESTFDRVLKFLDQQMRSAM